MVQINIVIWVRDQNGDLQPSIACYLTKTQILIEQIKKNRFSAWPAVNEESNKSD